MSQPATEIDLLKALRGLLMPSQAVLGHVPMGIDKTTREAFAAVQSVRGLLVYPPNDVDAVAAFALLGGLADTLEAAAVAFERYGGDPLTPTQANAKRDLEVVLQKTQDHIVPRRGMLSK